MQITAYYVEARLLIKIILNLASSYYFLYEGLSFLTSLVSRITTEWPQIIATSHQVKSVMLKNGIDNIKFELSIIALGNLFHPFKNMKYFGL